MKSHSQCGWFRLTPLRQYSKAGWYTPDAIYSSIGDAFTTFMSLRHQAIPKKVCQFQSD